MDYGKLSKIHVKNGCGKISLLLESFPKCLLRTPTHSTIPSRHFVPFCSWPPPAPPELTRLYLPWYGNFPSSANYTPSELLIWQLHNVFLGWYVRCWIWLAGPHPRSMAFKKPGRQLAMDWSPHLGRMTEDLVWESNYWMVMLQEGHQVTKERLYSLEELRIFITK